jgi:hypothetical protein
MSILFLFHYFKTSNVVLKSIPCSPHFQVLILQSRIDVTNKYKIDKYVRTFRFNQLPFTSWFKFRGPVNNAGKAISNYLRVIIYIVHLLLAR